MGILKLFYLKRTTDKTGVSGTGRVAEVIQFDNGKCVIYWNNEINSIVIHDSLENVKKIHVHEGTELKGRKYNEYGND